MHQLQGSALRSYNVLARMTVREMQSHMTGESCSVWSLKFSFVSN